MRTTRLMSALALPLALGALLSAADAQGKGQSGERKPDKAQGQGRGAAKQGKGSAVDKPTRAAESRGNPQRAGDGRGVGVARDNKGSRVVREAAGSVERRGFRTFAMSDKKGQRLVGRAISRAAKRGVADDVFFITPMNGRVHVLNRSGVLLLDLDDDRDIGNWRVVTAPFRDREGAPSFCRSGEGHPVWGRQWCIDKGFGLGVDNDVRWARVIELGDVAIRPRTEAEFTRDVLLDVLGDVVFSRLAAHAITLGLVEPLSGRWLGEAVGEGPRVLLLTSGSRPVAEIVDVDRDGRAEILVVAVRP